ncbi:hypothetical protein N9878_00595 [bacterium]|nr:hypothetical protein [bacterium]
MANLELAAFVLSLTLPLSAGAGARTPATKIQTRLKTEMIVVEANHRCEIRVRGASQNNDNRLIVNEA